MYKDNDTYFLGDDDDNNISMEKDFPLLKEFNQTLGFQLNEVGEKGDPQYIPILTYRKDIKSSLEYPVFIELGVGFLSDSDHYKFALNIDLFKSFLTINKINFTFGPGINIIY